MRFDNSVSSKHILSQDTRIVNGARDDVDIRIEKR